MWVVLSIYGPMFIPARMIDVLAVTFSCGCELLHGAQEMCYIVSFTACPGDVRMHTRNVRVLRHILKFPRLDVCCWCMESNNTHTKLQPKSPTLLRFKQSEHKLPA
jgi:hypothetical protein